jgi:two-component system response regulator GlrR
VGTGGSPEEASPSVAGSTEVVEVDDAAVLRLFRLQVEAGPDAGAVVRSQGERLVIGTHRSADLVLTDSAVSRFHAELLLEGGTLVVRDLDSRNGTFVGGLRVREAILTGEHVLTVGRTRVAIELDAGVGKLSVHPGTTFGSMVGESLAMRHVFSLLERAAPTDSTVLLSGETGTGKEAAARSLHATSRRAAGPFVVVDCAAVPSALFEAELFGHERGAFTGAHAAREGAFEAAEGGTLFIDEIGELSLELQPKLLRVLERREVKRVGSQQATPIDVRIVAATHRDLRGEVNARRFREDLYYRLAIVEVRLPPLRERREDIPPLVRALSGEVAARAGGGGDVLGDPALLAEIQRHQWPGNVRELRNFLERAVVLGPGARPTAHAEGAANPVAAVDGALPLREARDAAIATFERAYLEALLQRHGDNASAAARAAGVDRSHFYRLLWRHGFR